MMGYGMGHVMALHAIVGLVISTAFLVWLGGKQGVPGVTFGKLVAWIAIILTGLMVIGSVVMCVSMVARGGMPCMRGAMMQEMMEKNEMPAGPMMMHPGMKMGPGAGPTAMPPPEGKK